MCFLFRQIPEMPVQIHLRLSPNVPIADAKITKRKFRVHSFVVFINFTSVLSIEHQRNKQKTLYLGKLCQITILKYNLKHFDRKLLEKVTDFFVLPCRFIPFQYPRQVEGCISQMEVPFEGGQRNLKARNRIRYEKDNQGVQDDIGPVEEAAAQDCVLFR